MASNLKYMKLSVEVLFVLLAISMGYVLGTATTNYSIEDKIHKTNKVYREVNELKTTYNSQINTKQNTFNELEAKKDKIQQLLKELEETKYSEASLLKYKEEYKNLESKMKILLDEINSEKNTKQVITLAKEVVPKEVVAKKASIVKKTPETVIAKTTIPKEVVPAVVKNEEVKPKVTYSKVQVSNLNSIAFTKNDETTLLSSKTKKIQISFILESNPYAKAENKKYYVQVINSKNNVIGNRVTEFFDNASLTYSFSKMISYNNDKIEIKEFISSSKFEKGKYYVFLFDRNEMVGSYNFTLQ